MFNLFASTSKGFEELLKQELLKLGAEPYKISQGGVYYRADLATLYKTLLWSRLASRILLPLVRANIKSAEDLYQQAIAIDWLAIFKLDSDLAINFNGTNQVIRNSQFGALKIKDAIVDYFVSKHLSRPNINKEDPAVQIHAWLSRDEVMISLDLSADPLHKRGYRATSGEAPLRENLAAAAIIRSGWDYNSPLIDPMCGSATILIEAAQMAANIAPNLNRQKWGFYAWQQHDETLWQTVKQQAKDLALNTDTCHLQLYGYDIDAKIIKVAQNNCCEAKVADFIQLQTQDIALLENPTPTVNGYIISNPPYGVRLESTPQLITLYSLFGQTLKVKFAGWYVSILSSVPALLDCLHLRAARKFNFKNGNIDCEQRNYLLTKKKTIQPSNLSEQTITEKTTNKMVIADLANRLDKNEKKLSKWAKQQHITAYRIYDADLPEYNFAIDRYADYLVVQEYQAPKQIEVKIAHQRLMDGVTTIINTFDIPTNKLILKRRQQQKGTQQYQKLSTEQQFIYVDEYNAKFAVNLTDYLDTGLFLDHRLTRQMVGKMAKDKHFLNLFAYTGSASVHAALNGAFSTTSVDSSNTYLNWAEQNFHLNHLTTNDQQHRFIREDCLTWLKYCRQKFDLIFVDPPTFSNSKRFEDTWDVQRDYVLLLNLLTKVLAKNGKIIFSNNKRGFKLDLEAVEQLNLTVTNITSQTIPLDFKRNAKIHNCWLLEA